MMRAVYSKSNKLLEFTRSDFIMRKRVFLNRLEPPNCGKIAVTNDLSRLIALYWILAECNASSLSRTI